MIAIVLILPDATLDKRKYGIVGKKIYGVIHRMTLKNVGHLQNVGYRTWDI